MPMKSHREEQGWFLPDAQSTGQHKPQMHFQSLLWEALLTMGQPGGSMLCRGEGQRCRAR